MAEDKVIKSGQLTLPRLLFLAVIGGVIVATVALGGVWLSIGYWLMSLGLCVLLALVAMDYGVNMERVELQPQASQTAAGTEPTSATEGLRPSVAEARPRRRSSRTAKRRR